MENINTKRETMETQVKTENVLKLLIEGDLPTTINHSNADINQILNFLGKTGYTLLSEYDIKEDRTTLFLEVDFEVTQEPQLVKTLEDVKAFCPSLKAQDPPQPCSFKVDRITPANEKLVEISKKALDQLLLKLRQDELFENLLVETVPQCSGKYGDNLTPYDMMISKSKSLSDVDLSDETLGQLLNGVVRDISVLCLKAQKVTPWSKATDNFTKLMETLTGWTAELKASATKLTENYNTIYEFIEIAYEDMGEFQVLSGSLEGLEKYDAVLLPTWSPEQVAVVPKGSVGVLLRDRVKLAKNNKLTRDQRTETKMFYEICPIILNVEQCVYADDPVFSVRK